MLLLPLPIVLVCAHTQFHIGPVLLVCFADVKAPIFPQFVTTSRTFEKCFEKLGAIELFLIKLRWPFFVFHRDRSTAVFQLPAKNKSKGGGMKLLQTPMCFVGNHVSLNLLFLTGFLSLTIATQA